MKTFLKIPRWTHASVWAITVLAVLGFESELLPTMLFRPDAEQMYALQMVAVALTLLGSYMPMRLMAFDSVKQLVRKQQEESAQRTYATLCMVRTALVELSTGYNLLAYYLTELNTTLFYCFLITAVASLFCWPSQTTFDALRAPETDKNEKQA